MLVIVGLFVAFVLVAIFAQRGTRGCRWRMDKRRDRDGLQLFPLRGMRGRGACDQGQNTAGLPRRNANRERDLMTQNQAMPMARRAITPVICYPVETLPQPDLDSYGGFRAQAVKTGEVLVPPRDAGTFRVPAGGFFRISSVEGPQVGDLNLWHRDDLSERFYSGKTRALHGTHVTTGQRLWSSFPKLRPWRRSWRIRLAGMARMPLAGQSMM
jgi:hypothetical protein